MTFLRVILDEKSVFFCVKSFCFNNLLIFKKINNNKRE